MAVYISFLRHLMFTTDCAIDALIEKFVPIDNGYFDVHQRLSEEQMKMLFGKCVLSNKTVRMAIPDDSPKIFDSVSPIDYDKYYSEREVLDEREEVCFRNKNKEKLDLQVHHLLGKWVMWKWSKPSRLPSS
uniref:RNA-directed RNA polymerase n=1 Tax=Steinernema glaseri TaxID=37863 RepID=A0A1I7YQI4_9BILA